MTSPARRPAAPPTKAQRGGAGTEAPHPGEAGGTARPGKAPRPMGRPAADQGRRNAYWLIQVGADSGPAVVRLADGRGVLPVFGFGEEAGLFARFARGGTRGVRRIGADGLASLLCGPLGGVELVALDPLSDSEADVLEGSVSLTRQRFLEFLPGPGNRPDPGGPAGSAPGGSAPGGSDRSIP